MLYNSKLGLCEVGPSQYATNLEQSTPPVVTAAHNRIAADVLRPTWSVNVRNLSPSSKVAVHMTEYAGIGRCAIESRIIWGYFVGRHLQMGRWRQIHTGAGIIDFPAVGWIHERPTNAINHAGLVLTQLGTAPFTLVRACGYSPKAASSAHFTKLLANAILLKVIRTTRFRDDGAKFCCERCTFRHGRICTERSRSAVSLPEPSSRYSARDLARSNRRRQKSLSATVHSTRRRAWVNHRASRLLRCCVSPGHRV